MKSLFIAALTLLASATPALADQCAVISAPAAVNAVSAIQNDSYVIHYCASCGDRVAVRRPIRLIDAKIFSFQATAAAVVVNLGDVTAAMLFAQVDAQLLLLINGDIADLAYIYDQRGINLGWQSGCQNSSSVELPRHVQVIGPRN